jgi:hypothetical protein
MLVALVCAVGAVGADGTARATPTPEPDALHRARAIAGELGTRYRLAPGRKLAVTEVTSTRVVASLTLVESWVERPRVVPAANGVYFALCTIRVRCPYPPPRAAWSVGAPMPRALALELAVRTLLETTLDLVVVALPTARPVWFVLERGELEAIRPGYDATSSRLYMPLWLDPVSATRETLVAVHLGDGE